VVSVTDLHDRILGFLVSAMLVPTFADRGCHVVSVTDFHDRILGFLVLTILWMTAFLLCTHAAGSTNRFWLNLIIL
jgi:hypothetical protein